VIERMDHAAVIAGVEALRRGKGASRGLFKKPSQDLEDAINGGRNRGHDGAWFRRNAGRASIIVDGEVIGAIGVSADTKEHDVQIARAGVAHSSVDCAMAFEEWLDVEKSETSPPHKSDVRRRVSSIEW